MGYSETRVPVTSTAARKGRGSFGCKTCMSTPGKYAKMNGNMGSWRRGSGWVKDVFQPVGNSFEHGRAREGREAGEGRVGRRGEGESGGDEKGRQRRR